MSTKMRIRSAALRHAVIGVGAVLMVGGAAVGIGAAVSPDGSNAASRSGDGDRSQVLSVRELRRGDLLVTDQGDVVRLDSKRRLDNGRYRLRRTSPWRDDDSIHLIGTKRGYRPGQVFVVLDRDVPVGAVQHFRSTAPTSVPTSEPTAS